MKTVFLALAVFTVFSCGTMSGQPQSEAGGKTKTQGKEKTIKLKGIIKIFGSEPHTFAGIVDEKGVEYSIYPPEKEDELRKLQGNLIEFTVILLDKPQGYGSLFLKGGTVTPVEWKIINSP